MKKEYLLLIIVIIGLSAYLGLKKDNQVNYELPVLKAIDAKAVDKIEITKAETRLILSKTDADGGWSIGEKAYPVAKTAVDNMMDTIKSLRLSALVSETGDLVRYELDKENGISVKALAKGEVVRQFSLGKTAPSFNHTFVMLPDDNRIFQADKSFRENFDKSLEDFRDKVILSFKTGEIKSISLEKEGITKHLTLKTEKKEDKEVSTWEADGTAIEDETPVQDLLASLSRLECQSYKSEKGAAELKKEGPSCKISLESKENLSLNLYEKGDTVAGSSSSSPYAFDLASYKAKDIISYIDSILGLEKEESASEKN
jgi:hypothetical protein